MEIIVAVYVDYLMTYPDSAIKPGIRHLGNQWCHMACDGDLEELHQFAAQLGMHRRWFQDHRLVPHYDLTPDRRALAIALGAIEITSGEFVRRLQRDRIDYKSA
jgi:hypothetical protein